ncbi:MAG: hypothetical protein R3202_15055, partial [Candidatus Competibacterales bacterium]|nr:hypothetical protein [Candidatus Competibacterales bacterium]
MDSIFLLGLMIGMRHALEADHVAAVAALATGTRGVRQTIAQGAVWGCGHTLTLLLFGGAVLLLGLGIPERVAAGLELGVGVLLVVLGIDVLRRLIRDRVHVHVHSHDDHTRHLHVHAHRGERGERGAHDAGHHRHRHPGFPLRALLVGMMHGMAGSAALIILTLQTVHSPLYGLAYILCFGLGSVLGMALLTATLSVPLHYSARTLTGLHRGFTATIGLATTAVGLWIIHD